MQLMLPERGKSERRLVFDRGQLAGCAYRVEPQICGNPVCQCKTFTLHCFPETHSEATTAPTPLTVELDLERRVLTKPDLAEATPASGLAKAVMDEMTSEQWEYLWSYFYALKAVYTERANLDKLDADFPPNASEGGMVGYYEILPFARPINFAAEGQEWTFDDQYCLRPDCSCRAAFLQCFRIPPQDADAAPQGPNLSFRYDYDTQRIENVENSGSSLSPRAFLESMRQAQPDLDALLAKRHAQLRRLYRGYLKRHPHARQRSKDTDAPPPDDFPDLPPEPVRVAQKPGRNDPCPCGSGRKYKKCCGRN
jgi:hypothetical protein